MFLAHTSTMQFTSLTDFSDKKKCCEKSIGLLMTNSFVLHLVRIQNTTDWEIASMLASLKEEEFVTDTSEGHSWEMGENKASSKTDIVTSTSCSSVGSCSDLSSNS